MTSKSEGSANIILGKRKVKPITRGDFIYYDDAPTEKRQKKAGAEKIKKAAQQQRVSITFFIFLHLLIGCKSPLVSRNVKQTTQFHSGDFSDIDFFKSTKVNS